MADEQQVNKSDAVQGDKFVNMNFVQKLEFIGKSGVFIITAGFAFPNIFSE